ncbi:hypothetical protein N8371_08975 [Vicingaceae bacterium]|nr:hypothetical protein [Vicingaceae bacterium]MDC1452519.1 hypothetical protein [Vicingaceae bacterium]
MKKLLLFPILYLSIQLLIAQPEDKKLGKITFLMVDGEYEDAADKAEKLKEDPEYRKNAWVYFYLSQSYFEIASTPELQEDYPKALKESIKAASKLAKYKNKPKENLKVFENASEFLLVLKDSVIAVSEIYYDNEDFRKAAYFMKSITRFSPDDYGVWLMKGVYEVKSRNIGEGVKSMLLAMDSLNEAYVPDEVSALTLVNALDEYVLILKSGEYDQYFKTYKFNPTQKDIDRALELKKFFMKYVEEVIITKEDRKKDSETIYKTFRSDDEEEDGEED